MQYDNVSTTEEETTPFNNYDADKWMPAIHIIFMFFGITFNIVTLLIVVRGKRFSKKLKIQLTNLTVADLLSSLVIFTGNAHIEFVTLPFPDSAALCKTVRYISSAIIYSSLLCHMSIALERFVAVYFPFSMVNYTKKKVVIVNVLVWIVGTALHIEYIFLSDVYPNPLKPNTFVCYTDFYSPLAHQLSLYYAIKFCIPTFTIFGVYAFIAVKLKCGKRPINSQQTDSKPCKNRVIVMLASNGIIAVGIWMPFYVFSTITEFSGLEIQHSRLISEILYTLLLTNCFVTSIIYFIFSDDFRMDMRELIRLKKHRSKENKRKQPPARDIAVSVSHIGCDSSRASNLDFTSTADATTTNRHPQDVITIDSSKSETTTTSISFSA